MESKHRFHYQWLLAVRGLAPFMLCFAVFLSGCTATGGSSTGTSTTHRSESGSDLRKQAVDCLRAGLTYRANPVVRAQAAEAVAATECTELLPWLRTALSDDQPAVRFAACLAVGTLRDPVAEARLRDLVNDVDVNVRLGALYALHQLGDTRRTGELSTYVLSHEDPVVRRHAAMIIGLIGEPSAVKLLARAMRDRDQGVRVNALEAMGRLGTKEATQELVFMTNSGVGAEETVAIHALARTRDRAFEEAYRYKMATAVHVETRLAAAAALGSLGHDDGFAEALRVLQHPPAPRPDPKDDPEGQMLRVKQLAAAALGEIGKKEALPALRNLLFVEKDPRVQVSGAQAVLKILQPSAVAKPIGPGPASRR